MLESLMFTQGKIVPPPAKGDITFKTSGTSATAITTSQLGSGFTTQYSIDRSPLVKAGTTFSIPAGDHEVTLKLSVTTGTALTLQPFAAILTEVIDWEGFQLSNIQFYGCDKLTKVPDHLPVTITSMSSMFNGCSSFNHAIGDWDTSNVTAMERMFEGCTVFNQYIGNWDTSQVTNMRSMFYNCTAFNQDIGQWDTSKVTNLSYMFRRCTSFNQDIGNWDTSNVAYMAYMFHSCTSFNQDISGWNVSQVSDISYMFYGCKVFNKDLSSMVFKSTVARTGYDTDCTAWNAAYRPKFTG